MFRYVSMADIVDLSSLVSASMVKFIDFRVFASLMCGLESDLVCFGLPIDSRSSSILGKLRQCGSLISGFDGNVDKCLYALDEDCRTTVWTYQQNIEVDTLDAFQPDEQLQKKKRIFYVRRRRDVHKALGPGSKAELATVVAFGSVFTTPYKGSELYIDIHKAPRDKRIQTLLQKIDFLPFVLEIMTAGKKFASEKIMAPFLCAQLRLLDGQFKNHWKVTFTGLKQKLELLQKEGPLPIHVFVMTDLPKANWSGSYLGELESDSRSFKLFNLHERDPLVVRTAEAVVTKKGCPPKTAPDILLYIEETICSCATLGFVGTVGSTIAESIELMRKSGTCSN
ncbi:hypothetical protein GIB67_015592 [Kingdonia uniflora]|uniref:Uncharacterized protein n=1 Tax=Kingdonia uniflora TaxID=39325 RepID=A0A7J7LUC0_9MAGN|nr:hypothetical protein GIB67_015592 [Kingdonia uniflora]